jgi:hypothetical protein
MLARGAFAEVAQTAEAIAGEGAGDANAGKGGR